ncbi:MAG TPA: ABC transporter ATP-binding protein [Solirubrobacter sp.]|nr:ABC transporter ATP-binding protein [Solirubrobacter sp.]
MALEVTGLRVAYGPITAVDGVSLTVEPRTVTSLVGPNGAGKSSAIRAIMGFVRSQGEVLLDGEPLSKRRTHARARAGLAYVPDGRGVFGDMTVKENIRVAAGAGWEARWEALAALFPVLGEKRAARASELSGGQQQALSIARALASAPRYILLDEPSMGLSPVAVKGVVEAIEQLSGTGVGVLLAEQNAALALSVSSMVHVMVRGEIRRSAEPGELRGTDELRALYLGRAAA